MGKAAVEAEVPSERDLSRLILAAYEAAAEPQKWPAFLKMLLALTTAY